MDYLPQFKTWLSIKGFSASTTRNYLADLGKYIEYVNHLPQSVSLDVTDNSTIHILSPDIVNLYVSYLSGKNNNARYLASLNKFCQFAIDQKLVSVSPFSKIHHVPQQPTLTGLVKLYEQHLLKHNAPVSTVRNYVNDLTQYISWLETTTIEPQ